MKIIQCLSVIGAFLMFQEASAQAMPDEISRDIEQRSLYAAQRYAERTGKPVPVPIDYRYGMRLDVAKVIYMTPATRYCGQLSKLMTYEDSQGELYTIRYRVQGVCRNAN